MMLLPDDVEVLTKMKAQARTAFGLVGQTVASWSLRLSQANLEGATRWALSARLTPLGRSSSDSDWNRLGQIVRILGAPEKPAIPIEQTDPNGWHEWRWVET